MMEVQWAQGWARAVGRIRGRGARGIVGLVGRAAARGMDGGAAWRAPWERVTVGWGPVGAGRGSDGAGERASVDAMRAAARAAAIRSSWQASP